MDRTVLPLRTPAMPRATSVDRRDQATQWPAPLQVTPPDGAPNILMIVIDDMGFGASSAFGGPCRMPAADRLASEGLRYTRFHTTALCSPTRAALLTGRNHHSVSMGAIPELATHAPGYTGVRPQDVAPIARTLVCNGYATGAFGKMHQTPAWEISHVGPMDRWPTQEGFQHFYGFLGGGINHFNPGDLMEGVTRVDPPKSAEQGYHFTEDIVDHTLDWIDSVKSVRPDQPWFAYLSYGATHAPMHVPEDWRKKYRGEFAHGWDAARAKILARQRELGVVPPETQLAKWPDGVPSWDDLTDTQREASERLMELYAAFAEHCDAQTKRVLDMLDETGQADNTIVMYLLGDNGASSEGGLEGTYNETLVNNGFQDSAEDILRWGDDLGGPLTFPQYPTGWALAMNTPYAWAKQVASHYGGTRNGLIVRWPSQINDKGSLRTQWHHVIDIVPTLLEAAGLPQPEEVDGFRQRPMEGTSFLYTFSEPDAPDQHITQYFEMFGNRGIYHEGWTAVTVHKAPWRLGILDLDPIANDTWELYQTNDDWSQTIDLAKTHPDKLRELQELFLVEAAKCQVFPIDDRLTERFNPALAPRPDLLNGRKHLVLKPSSPRLRENVAPNFKNTSFTIRAKIQAGQDPANGVIISQGGRFCGWAIYFNQGIATYCHNLVGTRSYVRADRPLEGGDNPQILTMRFEYDGGIGGGGQITFDLDGEPLGEGRVEATTPFLFSHDETLDIGVDRASPVVEEYGHEDANRFTGHIEWVEIQLGGDAVEPPAEAVIRAHMVSH